MRHLSEPTTAFPTGFTGPGPTNRLFAGHGYRLDDDTFHLPSAMGAADLAGLHGDLHTQATWPHSHRLLHDNERRYYANELGLPAAPVDRWSEAGQLLSFALPRDEQQRQQRLLAFGERGVRYVYTPNGQVILQLHRTPTRRDLLRHAGHAASTLYCGGLGYHLDRLRDADLWRPTTLAAHNQTIRQLTDHPEQRERVGQHWRVYLLCDECDRAGRLAAATRDPVETDIGADVTCACGHRGDQHRVGPIVLWRLAPHGGSCTMPGCACTELRPQTLP